MSPTTRTPDQILADFDAGCQGRADIDMRSVLWEVLEDVLSSIKLAEDNMGDFPDVTIHDSMRDYLVNSYGDD